MIPNMLLRLASKCASILFPSYCYICKKESNDTSICSTCLSSFTKAIDTPAPYITSIYSFRDERIKKIIHAIKYFHRKDLLIPFVKVLSEEIKNTSNLNSYTLVPIPMPTFRKYVRGYNHGETLASELSKALHIPFQKDILLRNHSVSRRRQVMTPSRHERLQNSKNVFLANKDAAHKNIILIDDVTTTGATLSEARKVLIKAGAVNVLACTIAH